MFKLDNSLTKKEKPYQLRDINYRKISCRSQNIKKRVKVANPCCFKKLSQVEPLKPMECNKEKSVTKTASQESVIYIGTYNLANSQYVDLTNIDENEEKESSDSLVLNEYSFNWYQNHSRTNSNVYVKEVQKYLTRFSFRNYYNHLHLARTFPVVKLVRNSFSYPNFETIRDNNGSKSLTANLSVNSLKSIKSDKFWDAKQSPCESNLSLYSCASS